MWGKFSQKVKQNICDQTKRSNFHNENAKLSVLIFFCLFRQQFGVISCCMLYAILLFVLHELHRRYTQSNKFKKMCTSQHGHDGEKSIQPGPSPARGQWCPAPPFKFCAPHFNVWSPGCCIHPILYLKM